MPDRCPKCCAENPDTVKFSGECGTQLLSLNDVAVTETMETPREELTSSMKNSSTYGRMLILAFPRPRTQERGLPN